MCWSCYMMCHVIAHARSSGQSVGKAGPTASVGVDGFTAPGRCSAGDRNTQPPRQESSSPTIQYLCSYVVMWPTVVYISRRKRKTISPNCRLPTCQLQPPRDNSFELMFRGRYLESNYYKDPHGPSIPSCPPPGASNSRRLRSPSSISNIQHSSLLLTYPRAPVSPPFPQKIS
jgi:hypothetical protein